MIARRVTAALLGMALLGTALLWGCTSKTPDGPAEKASGEASKASAPQAADTKAADTKAADTKAADTKAADTKAAEGPLPGADRVFVAPLTGGFDCVLGADSNALWAARPTAAGQGEVLWRITGPGAAQKVAFGDLGQGPKLFVAWGIGRGLLGAPLVVQEVDPKTGAQRDLFRTEGQRNEAAHLSIADVDRDGTLELAFARYASKYMVEARPIEANGQSVGYPAIRMASSWLYADLDGQKGPEAVVGRVYGDARGEPGDLRVRTAEGEIPVPTDKGVKALLFASIGGDAPHLYFADGWVANYGKEAKAQLKRMRLVDGKPEVSNVGGSPDEFTFFELTAVDLDFDGAMEIAAQGNKRVTLFSKGPKGWQSRPLADLEPVINTAIGRTAEKQWTLFIPARPNVRAVPLQ